MGDSKERFSIQSISKVFTLYNGYAICWERIYGKEFTLSQAETLLILLHSWNMNAEYPRNPFINAGALVIADILVSNLEDPKKPICSDFVRKISQTILTV
jgi:glutaminase